MPLLSHTWVRGCAECPYVWLTTQQDSRPSPPQFELHRPESNNTAYGFMRDYALVVQDVIARTPYNYPTASKRRLRAQERFAQDGSYLKEWLESGSILFLAKNQTDCVDFVHYGYLAWRAAYPIKQDIRPHEWLEKKMMALNMHRSALICLDALQKTELPAH